MVFTGLKQRTIIMNRYISPVISSVDIPAKLNPGFYTLDNGVSVYEMAGGNTEIIKIDINIPAGSYYQNKPFCAASVNRMLTEGTTGFSSVEISEKTDYYGAFLQGGSDKDNAVMTLLVPRRHIEALMPLLAAVILSPVFPEHELGVFLQKQKQHFRIEQTKVRVLANAAYENTMFGSSHPYGIKPEEKDFGNINRELLTAFHRKHYFRDKWKIMVSGMIKPSDRSLINSYFGQIQFNNVDIKAITLPDISAAKVFVHREDAVQSAIRMGIRVPNRTHPDYPLLSLLNTLLGGYFGSRLMQNLREEKGYTYGIYSFLVNQARATSLNIATEVGADVTGPAIKEIYKEIRLLLEEPVSTEELNRVKSQIMGDLMRAMDGPFARADLLFSLLESGFGPDYIADYVQKIKDSTPESILEIAGKYLRISDMVEVVSGPDKNFRQRL